MLDESEVIKWGAEIFKQAVAMYEDMDSRYGDYKKFPISYTIYGAKFYRWGFRKGIAVASNAIDPFDPHNPLHHNGLQIALWIGDQLDSFEDVMNIDSQGDVQEYLRGDESFLIEMYNNCLSFRDNPLYPYLPEWYLQQLVVATRAYEKRCTNHIKSLVLAKMRTSTNHGFVYLVQSPTGSYKIGRTKDPDNRMKTFSVKLPFEVDYVCVIETADMYSLERQLHGRYASKRVGGEWFCLEPQDVAYITSLVEV